MKVMVISWNKKTQVTQFYLVLVCVWSLVLMIMMMVVLLVMIFAIAWVEIACDECDKERSYVNSKSSR